MISQRAAAATHDIRGKKNRDSASWEHARGEKIAKTCFSLAHVQRYFSLGPAIFTRFESPPPTLSRLTDVHAPLSVRLGETRATSPRSFDGRQSFPVDNPGGRERGRFEGIWKIRRLLLQISDPVSTQFRRLSSVSEKRNSRFRTSSSGIGTYVALKNTITSA